MNNVLNFLGLIKKAGKLTCGDESCYDAVRTGRAKIIAVASDASLNAVNRAKGYAGETKGGLIVLPCTKAELGRMLGRDALALIAVCDWNFAHALIEKLPPESISAWERAKKKDTKNSEGERDER